MLAMLAVPLLALVLSTPPGDLIDGLRHPLALSALLLVGTFLLFGAVPKGFIPSTDTGQVSGTTETAQAATRTSN